MNSRHLYSSLTRSQKRLFFVLLDLLFLPAALWSSFALRFSDVWPVDRMAPFWWMFILVPVTGVVIFVRLGLYRAVIRYIGDQAVIAVIKGVLLLSFSLYVVAHLSGVAGFPRSIPINFAIISALYVAGSRLLVKSYYHRYINSLEGKEAVLIYGAGEAGMQLALSMMNSRQFRPAAFIDDDDTLHGEILSGLSVYPPSAVKELIRRFEVELVVIAVPAASRQRRRQIVEKLQPHAIRVQTLPSLAELASGTSSFEQLQEVELDDLLGRDVVVPDEKLLTYTVSGKVVMVTGAGGSIGSELCRQIVRLSPRTLIMFDNSEFALYSIDNELSQWASTENSDSVNVVSTLGSVLDASRVDSVVRHYGVETLFHAAAYKHVPMVERNVHEGVRNNVFGTRTVAKVAQDCGVERFILVSTDKAVRPTSVMGATKRVAEQVIQSLAEQGGSTIFSMVRFGNVLGSSGSVVPLFRNQIENGGPVTVTDKNVTRYFMSIPEAAQLVIQAASMSKGGDVFVLDMGEPVKIYDLARNMIELSGHSVRDTEHSDGDISIEIIGLRAGEKLYEELLIGDNVEQTEHRGIMRANEERLDAESLRIVLEDLECTIASGDEVATKKILQSIVSGYSVGMNG